MNGIATTELPLRVAKGVVRGKSWAVEEAYRMLSQRVMNQAMRILNDRSLAEEVVQDTFIDLLEKCRQIKEPSGVPGWVRKVATNHCLMKLRSPWHAKRIAGEDFDTMEESTADTSTSMERNAVHNDLANALASLPVETRAVIWLHDVEGYTHREIGDLMGRTTSFSKSQLARGYEKLLAWSQQGELHESKDGTVRTIQITCPS